MENYLKINQVAKLFSVTPKTIRYYEEYGLVTPEYIDPENNYRYYGMDNIQELSYIVVLRNTGFSMQEIKELVIDNTEEEEKMLAAYLEKRKMLDNIITTLQQKVTNYKDLKAKIVTFEDCYINRTFVSAKTTDEFYDKYKRYLNDVIAKDKNALLATPAGIYIPLEQDFSQKIDSYVFYMTAKGHGVYHPKLKAISTFYNGSLAKVRFAYFALKDYAVKHNLEVRDYILAKHYHPTDLHKQQYIIEVLLPLK